MPNLITRKLAGLATNAQTAWQWAKTKLPTTLPPGYAEIEPHLREFLATQGFLGTNIPLNYVAIATSFAAFVADPTHSFGAAFAHLPISFVKNLTVVAAKDGLQYLASRGEIGPHEDVQPDLLNLSLAGVFGKIVETEEKGASPPAVAGKIEPAKPDPEGGPQDAA